MVLSILGPLHPRLNGITPNIDPKVAPPLRIHYQHPHRNSTPRTMTTCGVFAQFPGIVVSPTNISTFHRIMNGTALSRAPPTMTQMAQCRFPSSPDKMVSPSQDLLSKPNVIITDPWYPPHGPKVSSPPGVSEVSPTLGLSPPPTKLTDANPSEPNSISEPKSLAPQSLSFPSPDQPPRPKVHHNQTLLRAGATTSLYPAPRRLARWSFRGERHLHPLKLLLRQSLRHVPPPHPPHSLLRRCRSSLLSVLRSDQTTGQEWRGRSLPRKFSILETERRE